jgi:hypothetical protein
MMKSAFLARSLAVLAVAAGLGLAVTPARACSVPVYRYALERWPPEPYEAILFHEGELDEAARKSVAILDAARDPSGPFPNLLLARVDTSKPLSDRAKALWEQQEKPVLPWLVVRYPAFRGEGPVLWRGPLASATGAGILDSPARREVVKRILSGQSAVWVLLESGDKARDDAAQKGVEEQLREIEKEFQPPELSPEDLDPFGPGRFRAPLPLRLAFSMLRVSRTDAAEKHFIHMLMQLAGDEPPPADQPIVFPIFGRGRALAALAGEDLEPEVILDAAAFLAGPCSCQVKEMNPGMDLLMTADWDSIYDEPSVMEPEVPNLADAAPALAEVAGAPKAAPDAAGAVAPSTPAPEAPLVPLDREETSSVGIPGLLLVVLAGVVGIGLVALVAATVVLRRRPPT